MSRDPTEHGWTPRRAVGLMALIGPLWARREGARWAYGLLATPSHANNAGSVHGGVVTTLADHALSVLAWEAMQRRPCVTMQLDTHFLAPAKPGDFIEVRGRVAHRTRSTLFLNGSLKVGETDIALATGIWKLATGGGHGTNAEKTEGTGHHARP